MSSPPLQRYGHGALLVAAMAISALGHLFLLIGLPALQLLRISAPVPIEVLPLKKRPPTPPQLPTPPAEPERPRVARPGAGKAAAPRPPALPPAPPVSDLAKVGPSSANITIILRGPLLARSPHRDGVDTLLSALPDYHTLLDGTGLHPFDDLEALLIATPDPRDVTATFLAARHRGQPAIARLATRSLGPADPRQFRALGADLMLLGRPDDLARIEKVEASPGETPTPEQAEAARWLDALRHFDERGKEAAFAVTIADLPALIRIPGGRLPLPRTVQLAMSAEAAPATRLVCLFDDEASSTAFFALWPELKQRLADSAPPFAGVLDGLVPTRREREVELVGRLPEAQVRFALGLVRLLTPRAPRPAAPVPAAEPSPEAQPE